MEKTESKKDINDEIKDDRSKRSTAGDFNGDVLYLKYTGNPQANIPLDTKKTESKKEMDDETKENILKRATIGDIDGDIFYIDGIKYYVNVKERIVELLDD